MHVREAHEAYHTSTLGLGTRRSKFINQMDDTTSESDSMPHGARNEHALVVSISEVGWQMEGSGLPQEK